MKCCPRPAAHVRALIVATSLAATFPSSLMAQAGAGIPYSFSNIAEPIQTVAGVVIGPTNGGPGVRVLDVWENPVTNTEVTVAVNTNAFQSGTTNILTDSNGDARFTNLVLTKAESGYRLTYTTTNGINITSDPFPVVATAPAFSKITVQPSNSVYGSPVEGSPTLVVYDQYTNAVRNGVGVRAALSTNGFRSGSTTNLSTDANGQVVFSNLVPGAVGTNYTITFDTQSTGVADTNSASFDVAPLELTIGGSFAANNKSYNGSNNATIGTNALSLVTPLPGDDVNLAAVATFSQATIGTNLLVSLTNSSLTGSATNNYTLSFAGAPTDTADITAAGLTISGSFASTNKTYNGSNNADISTNALVLVTPAVVDSGDTNRLRLEAVAVFSQIDAGNGIEVNLTNSTLAGTSATNYALSFSGAPVATNNILPLQLTIAGGFSSADKNYDGLSNATIVSNGLSLATPVPGDDIALDSIATFPQSTVGSNLVVSLTNSKLTGTATNNYTLSFTGAPVATNSITQRPVTIAGSFGVSNRPYNASNNAVIATNGLSLSNVIDADTNSVTLQAVATFDPFTVGTNTAYLTNSTLAGTSATNYSLSFSNAPTAMGVISGRLVTIAGNFTAADRPYNGSNNATITSNNLSLAGLEGGDTNTVSLDAVATFAQTTVGTNIAVSLEDSSLSGSNSANYNLSFAGAPTDAADITPAALDIGGAFLASGKVYDGTTTAVITSNNLTLLTPAPVDQGNTNKLRLVPAAAFSQSSVGTNLTVSLTTNSSLAGSSATNYFLTNFAGAPTTTAGISNRPVYITGSFGVSNKVYNNSGAASFSISNLALSNLVGTDSNAVDLGAIASFNPFTAGTNPVFLTNSYLTNKVGTTNPGTYLNYALSFSNAPTNSAVISNRPVTVIGSFTSTNKVYDNTVAATIVSNALELTNFAPGEGSADVALVPEAVFNQPTVGTNIRVFLSTNSYLTNSKAPNYVLSLSNGPETSNNITERNLTLTVGESMVMAGQSTNLLNPKPTITPTLGDLATNDTVASVVGTNTNYTSIVLSTTNRTVAGVYSNDLGVLTEGIKATNYNITTNLGELTITASNASMISVVSDPLQTTAGDVIPGLNLTSFSNMPPAVRVTDAFSNIVTNFSVSVGLSTNGFASGSTNATTDTNGVAAFADLVVNKAGVGYFLLYSGTGITNSPVESEQFSVIAAEADALNIVQQPLSAMAGENLNTGTSAPPQVQLVDKYGNPVLVGPYSITATVDPTATIFGPTVQTNNSVDGTATFAGMSIRKAGDYIMAFTPAGAGLEVTNSLQFTISANTNSARVSIGTEPSNSVAGTAISPNPVVLVLDQYNNAVANQSLSATLLQGTNSASYATNSTTSLVTDTSGQATFSNLFITQANTNYAAVFSLPYAPPFGAGSVTSVTFAITHAGVSGFSFAAITPTNKVAGVDFPVTITAIDSFSNTVTSFTNPVVLTLTNTTNSLASGTPTGGFTAGVLSNHQVSIRVTNNNYQITATFTNASTTATGTSGGFRVGPAAADSIRLIGPTNVVAGSTSSNFTLTVYDQFTNVALVTNNTLFSLRTSQESNSATFTPTNLTISNNTSSGTFTYRNTKVGTTNHVITATYTSGDAGLVGDTNSATIAVLPGDAAGLVMVTDPAPTAAAGVTFTQQPSVQFVDQFTNNVDTNASVASSIASGNPALEGTVSITATNGLATFTNLAIGGIPGTRTLNFTSTGLASVNSSNVDVGVGPAAMITMVEEPSQAPAGQKITNYTTREFPTVRVADKYTNSITNQAVTVSLTPTNSFAAASTTNADTTTNGEAIFSNLVVTNAYSPYRLAFSAGDATNASRQFAIVAGEVTQVLVDTQPAETIAGQKVAGPPTAQLLDEYANPVGGETVFASLKLGTNSADFAGGSTESSSSGDDGRVVFSNLVINSAGTNYSIAFDTDVAGKPGTNTTNFVVVPDLTNARIAVTTQPGNSTAGSPVPGFPKVQVTDQFSNHVSDIDVFVALNTNNFLATSTTNVALGTNGMAEFTNLRIGPAWTNYALEFVLQGYTNVTTNSSAFTNSPAEASKLVVTQQPSATNQAGKVFSVQPIVRLQDDYDNDTTNSAVVVVATLASGDPTLTNSTSSSNTATTVNGVASFANLRIDGRVGVRTLNFAATNQTNLSAAVSSNVVITAGDLAGLEILTQPVRTTAGTSILGSGSAPLLVRATDKWENNVSGAEVVPSPYDGKFFFSGGNDPVKTDTNGEASFGELSTTEAGMNYRISFASGGSFETNSALFSVIPASPEDLVILQQPFGGVVDSPLAPNPEVQLTDRFGNPTTSATPYNIGVRIIGSTFTEGSTTAVMTGTEGTATFADLTPATNGLNVELAFDIDGKPAAVSDPFNIIRTNDFQPDEVTFVSLSGSAEDLEVGESRDLVATLLNAAGETVTNSSDNVTFAASSDTGGAVSGLSTVAASNGVASNTVVGEVPGEVELTASAGSVISEKLSFTVIGVELAILKIERTTSDPAAFAIVPQSTQEGMTIQSTPGEPVVQITFKVNPNHNFTVWKAPSLESAWTQELQGTAQEVETIVELPVAPGEPKAFYKISAEPGSPSTK